MMESLEGILIGVIMLIVATVIMSAFYGVPYLIWKGFNKLMNFWDRHSIRKTGR